jgi:enolase
MKISSLNARPILDSRGQWTVEVSLTLQNGIRATASVPQGKSTGATEAHALPAAAAVRNINATIATRIIHKDFFDQAAVDEFLVRLDGTATKSRLGANAILAVSIAFLRATAHTKKLPLWKHIRDVYGVWVDPTATALHPRLFMNVVNGGLHAGNNLHFQEYLIIPKTRTFRESIDIGMAIYHALGTALVRVKGPGASNLGDEGGFAPNFKNDLEPFQMLRAVAKKLKLDKKIDFGLDAAATDVKGLTRTQLGNAYKKLIKEYEPLYIEDPFGENDFKNFAAITAANIAANGTRGAKSGSAKLWIAGDDLTTTNTDRMELAHAKKSINAIIIKPNQIGTITETLNAVRLAREYRWAVVVSHRSGETNDDFIADFAYGVAADGFKLGAPARGERVAKYNRLLEIESGK